MTRWIKILVVVLSIMLLAGCYSKHKKPNQAAINDANAAYQQDGAETSGLGEEGRFGEQDGGNHEQLLSKRTYYFDFDSNVVHDEDKAAIEANASYLVAHPNMKVLLAGHTDPRGSREYNIGLGERRAKAVAAILTAHGVNPRQIRVVSYGAEKLASPGYTEADYQLDRRVILSYTQR